MNEELQKKLLDLAVEAEENEPDEDDGAPMPANATRGVLRSILNSRDS